MTYKLYIINYYNYYIIIYKEICTDSELSFNA